MLFLLAENGRQSFSEIGEKMGFSGPAVSDYVSRLQEIGMVEGFTIDFGRSKLRNGTAILIHLDLPINTLESELHEKHLFADAVFLVNGALWLQAGSHCHRLKFKHVTNGNRMPSFPRN